MKKSISAERLCKISQKKKMNCKNLNVIGKSLWKEKKIIKNLSTAWDELNLQIS